MVQSAVQALDPKPGSWLFIENVGNLVCPALFDVGEHAKVVIISVTEGQDKPLKYPHMDLTNSANTLSSLKSMGKGGDPLEPPEILERLSETGERIDSLLSALGTAGPVAQQRGEDLVALVTNLYGAGLERLLEVLADAGRLDDTALDALAGDELVSGLLLVHGCRCLPIPGAPRRQ